MTEERKKKGGLFKKFLAVLILGAAVVGASAVLAKVSDNPSLNLWSRIAGAIQR